MMPKRARSAAASMPKRARSTAVARPSSIEFLGDYFPHDFSHSERVYLAEYMCNSKEWAEFSPVVVKSGNYVGVIFECHKDPLGDPIAGVDVREDGFDFSWSYATRLKERITSTHELHRFISEVARLSQWRMGERDRAINFNTLHNSMYGFGERKLILQYIVTNPAWTKFSIDYADNEYTDEVYGEIGSLRRTLGVLKLPRDNEIELWWGDELVNFRRITSMTELNEFVEWAMDYAEDNTPIRFYTR